MKVSIVITRYNEPNDWFMSSLNSLSEQRCLNARVYVLDQMKEDKIKLFCKNISNKNIKFIYIQIPKSSLSEAKNYGILKSKEDIVLFFEPDMIAEKQWAKNIVLKLSKNDDIAIACSKIVPLWESKPNLLVKSCISCIVFVPSL